VQANPNEMLWSPFEKSTRIVTRGGPDSGDAAARVMRVPPGHPEGYLEGFANIYSEVALCDQSGARGEEAAEGRPLPDHRRRRQRPRFHRGRSEIVESQCEMGEAVRRAGSGRRSPEAVRLGAQDGAAQKQRRRPRAAGEVLRVRQTRRRPATS
jgi:hypothetical protein